MTKIKPILLITISLGGIAGARYWLNNSNIGNQTITKKEEYLKLFQNNYPTIISESLEINGDKNNCNLLIQDSVKDNLKNFSINCDFLDWNKTIKKDKGNQIQLKVNEKRNVEKVLNSWKLSKNKNNDSEKEEWEVNNREDKKSYKCQEWEIITIGFDNHKVGIECIENKSK